MTKNELLVTAGIIAARKWHVKPFEINIKFVDSLEPFMIEVPTVREIENPPKEWFDPPENDTIEFENYSDTHFGHDDDQVFLAWGPKTKTLVICYHSPSG